MAIPPKLDSAHYLNPEFDLHERTRLALNALNETKSAQEKQRLAIEFDKELMEKVAFIHPELEMLVRTLPDNEVEIASQQNAFNQAPSVATTDKPASITPLAQTKPIIDETKPTHSSTKAPKPISFKIENSFEDIKQLSHQLEQKYESFKSEIHSNDEKIDYSFKNRDCQYSGKVDKKGSGHITIKNTGIWTQRDVDDFIEHICNDIGSKSVRIHENTITPQSMLIKACEELELRGLIVRITNNDNEIKSISDIKTELTSFLMSNPQQDIFSDYPNEIQEQIKVFEIELAAMSKELAPLRKREKELDIANHDNIDELNSLFAQMKPILDDSDKKTKEYINLFEEWLSKNPDHTDKNVVIQKIKKLEISLEEKAKKVQEIEAKYEAEIEANIDEILNPSDEKLLSTAAALANYAEEYMNLITPPNIIATILSESQREDIKIIAEELKLASEKITKNTQNYIEISENLHAKLTAFIETKSYRDLSRNKDTYVVMHHIEDLHQGMGVHLKDIKEYKNQPSTPSPVAAQEQKINSMKELMYQTRNPDAFASLNKKGLAQVKSLITLVSSLSAESADNQPLANEVTALARKIDTTITAGVTNSKTEVKINIKDFTELKEKLVEFKQKEQGNKSVESAIEKMETIEPHLVKDPSLISSEVNQMKK